MKIQVKYKGLTYVGLAIALSIIVMSTILIGIPIGLAIACIPFVFLYIYLVLANPYWGLITLFCINYFMIPLIRYSNLEGLSIIVDITVVFTLISMLINTITSDNIQWSKVKNKLTVLAFIWFIYCVLEIINPTGMVKAWVLSRGLTYHFLCMTVFTFILFNRYKDLKKILYIWSFFTIIGALKAFMQQRIGFDYAETAWLNAGAYKTHLLLTGTRYFSIFGSAGLFGAAMGQVMVVFSIAAFTIKGNRIRVYFFIIALLGLYGLMISGTRGALAVPLGGYALYVVLSKRLSIIIPGVILLAIVYIFFAFTTIGQGNQHIRRMRTAFDSNDPSLMVRKNNQVLFKDYLKNKPFGEGLGLSGVDAQNISMRYTTSIPTDSWFVKIWVETGIIGLLLHIGILCYIVGYGSYIIMFKIRNRELKGLLSAILCGVFGILISSYGNQVLGQYPIVFIVYMGIAFVFMGKDFDKEIAEKQSEAQ